MQIIPAIVSHFHYPHSYHASSSSSSNIAQIGDGSGPVQVAIKWARGRESIRTLEQEYEVYEETLKPLQGSVVPICYGLFAGRVEGEYVACLVLEWCGGVRKVDDIELIRQKMVGAVKLHKAGIQHNGLFKPQHYLFTTSTNQLRIIDFSQATSHVCPGSMPRIRNLSNGLPPDGCGELDALEALFTDGVVLDEEEEGRESVWDCFAQ
ncbi:hypothetical protein K474DRAFT_1597267 [Panus rudis PR-1116 ss-1]|nr:hypothetical protein K474DRAFT_1597267 [Panus rudis PR-1116 ss-1]